MSLTISDQQRAAEEEAAESAHEETRVQLARAIQVIQNLLKFGEHEGECTNSEAPHDEPCALHLLTQDERVRDAQAFLRTVEADSPSLTELQVEKLFHAIEHGDEQHRAWLYSKLHAFFHIE